MKKLLVLLALSAALLVPGSASSGVSLGAPAETPVGTFNLDVQNVADSTFTFNQAVVPPDPQLEALNGDNVSNWVGGPGSPDLVAQYPGYIRYQTLECARVQFSLPDNTNPSVDTGWHCAPQTDQAFTQDSITATASDDASSDQDTVNFTGNGNDFRSWSSPGQTFPQVDLSSYAGLTLDGIVYSNVCTRIYTDTTYYPPGGDSGVNSYLGCVGSTDTLTIQAASKSGGDSRALATTTPCTKYANGKQAAGGSCNPTAIAGRLPGGCVIPRHLGGKTVRQARVILVKHNCLLGKLVRKHSRVRKNRVVKPLMKVGSIHRVHTRVPLVVSKGR